MAFVKCRYCGCDLANGATIDHIVPRCQGGSGDPRNVGLSCRQCNSSKGQDSIEEFRMRMRFAASSFARIISFRRMQQLKTMGAVFPPFPEHHFRFEVDDG